MESPYFDLENTAAAAAAGRHRELIGGLWDEVGSLQFEFLKDQGLKPEHKLLDVGCGSLRGGVHFVGYLAPGHYFGVDINQSLLDAGYNVELKAAGLQERLPRANLLRTSDFDLEGLDGTFDFALAQSLFTHLTFNRIRQCLERLAPAMKPGGIFYATFFEVSDDTPADQPLRHAPGGVTTFDVHDPYHYRVADFEHAARNLPWSVRYVGDWNHPRGQRMLAFTRRDDGALQVSAARQQRDLPLEKAARLGPGAAHYRAYVGPPDRYDFMSATQFSLLFANGLRDHHRVLDFGCGSLRLGRLLIPFLQEGRYYGMEPNRWLIDDAIERELGCDAIRLKRPVFSYRDDFDCAALGTSFDFIVAQSIVTHCGPDLFARVMKSFRAVCEPDGLILFSYWQADEAIEKPEDGWHYPRSVRYSEAEVATFLADAGLVGTPIPWFHPRASWYLAARSPDRLPTEAERRLLTGAVLFDPQFAESRMAAIHQRG